MKLLRIPIIVLLVSFLFLTPFVLADNSIDLGNPLKLAWEPIKEVFDFDITSIDIVPVMRALFWLVIFTISFAVFRWLANTGKGFEWLKGNIAIVLAVALSAISAVFVPEEALMAIGATYGEIGILILFLPIFVGLIAVAWLTKSKVARIVILFILLYMLVYFHNLFGDIQTIDGMKTFQIENFKINDKPVTVKGLADLIVVLGMSIVPIWLIIEIFLGFGQGFGGESGPGGPGGLFGKKEEGEDRGRGPGEGPGQPPERLEAQIVQPRNGQVVRRGDPLLVEGVFRGGSPPFRTQISIDNGQPITYNVSRRRFTYSLETNKFGSGAKHQIGLNVWDKINQYVEAEPHVIIFEGEDQKFEVRIINPRRPGMFPQEFEREKSLPVEIEFVGGSSPFSYQAIFDDDDKLYRTYSTVLKTNDRKPPFIDIPIRKDLPKRLNKTRQDAHILTVNAEDSSEPKQKAKDNVEVILKAGGKPPIPPTGKPEIKKYPPSSPQPNELFTFYNLMRTASPGEVAYAFMHYSTDDYHLRRFGEAFEELLKIRNQLKDKDCAAHRAKIEAKIGAKKVSDFEKTVDSLKGYYDKLGKFDPKFATSHVKPLVEKLCVKYGLTKYKGTKTAFRIEYTAHPNKTAFDGEFAGPLSANPYAAKTHYLNIMKGIMSLFYAYKPLEKHLK